MGISWGNVAGQALIGGIGGAGQAAYVNAMEEQKAERRAVEEERLSKLRMGEYKAKTEMERQDKDAAVAKERGEVAEFYKRTADEADKKLGKPAVSSVDTLGNEEGEAGVGLISAAKKPSRLEVAGYRREEANKTGNASLIKQSSDEDKELRQEDEAARKVKFDETKAKTAERLATLRELEIAVKEKDAETRARKTDALIAKALGGSGEGKEPAKIREVKAIAEMAFGGDIEQAVSFVYGVQDKPRASAVMQMAKILKDGNYQPPPGTPAAQEANALMAEAERMVDSLRSRESGSRGGVRVGGPAPAVTPAPTPGEPWKRPWGAR